MRVGSRVARRTACSFVLVTLGAAIAQESLPTVQAPPENEPNEAKRLLGKMLFFEEQLSSDDTVACATCHVMTKGGTDPRRSRNPGSNSVFGDLGDVMGSPGVQPMDANGKFHPVEEFGTLVQVTPRTAPTPFAAPYQDNILWDGRATSQFKDPDTGAVVIASGGALESQALLPLTNTVEMGHEGRTLAQVTSKLETARPLALAADLPPDLAYALSGEPTYPDLFREAFGDDAITPARIAMAIATYERTLVADQTPFDHYAAGQTSALSPQEVRGLNALTTAKCVKCHAGPLFTDGSFRATGVRAPKEDLARGVTTSSNSDRGKFKVPTLRNVALKSSFFHDGQRASLSEAIDFYAVEPGPAIGGVFTYAHLSGHNNSQLPNEQFADNQDPIMQTVTLTTQNAQDILAFLQNGLVDPRVATGTFPFDSPVLASQRPLLTPILHGDGRSSGTFVPQVAVRTPAVAGSDSFTVDIAGGRAGAPARLLSWSVPSADGLVHVSDPIVLATDHGATFGSTAVSLADAKAGTRMQFAWMVEDADAPGGFAVSPTASVVVFDQRPRYVAGTPVPSPVSSAVGDGDAYVESAKYVVGLTRTNDQPYTDSFSFVAWMNPAGQAAQPSNGTVSLTLGGAVLLEDAQLDAKGRLSAQGVTGSYNRKTGRLAVTMRGLDLRNAIVTPFSLPIRIEVNGLGLAAPVATTTLNFAAKTGANGVTVGKFAYRASGTGNGVFRATSAHARLVDSGRARLQLTLVVDTPGPLASWTPGSVAISVGAVQPFEYSETALGVSGDGTTYSADRDGDLKKLRIDVIRRTLTLDAVTDVPALTGAAPGTRVDIPVTLTMQPSTSTTPVTFRTTASVTVGRR